MLRILFLPLSVKLISRVFVILTRLSFLLSAHPPRSPLSPEQLLRLTLEEALFQVELLKFANRMLQQKLLDLTPRPRFLLGDKLSLAFASLLPQASSLTDIFPVKWTTIKKWASALKRERITALLPCSRRPHAFPQKTSEEVDALACRMKRENPCWGYERIAGELKNLGITIHRSTVRRILIRRRFVPPTGEAYLSWIKIVTSQPHEMWAMDVFRARLWRVIPISICLILDDYSRTILGFSVGFFPTVRWILSCLKEAIERYGCPFSLLTDNGSCFRTQFDACLASRGIAHKRCAVGHPQTNGKVERLWKSIKEEFLNRMLIVSRQHLTGMLKEYVRYYNGFRPHQGIQNSIPREKLEGKKENLLPLYGKGVKLKRITFAGGLLTSYILKDAA